MRCPACSAEEQREGTFCPACGARLHTGPKTRIERATGAPISLRILMESLQRRLEVEYPQVKQCPQWDSFPVCGVVGGVTALAIMLHYEVQETERTPLEHTMRRVLMQRFPNSERAYEDCYHFVTEAISSVPRAERGKYLLVSIASWVMDAVADGQSFSDEEYLIARVADVLQNETIGFGRDLEIPG